MSASLEVVDDSKFAIGLCELFREAMAPFETTVVLPLAEEACRALGLGPAPVPGRLTPLLDRRAFWCDPSTRT
jgi:hypothetical protein